MESSALPPTGLMCELMAHAEKARIETAHPRLGWIVNDARPDAMQTAYRILVASDRANLEREQGDMWDSGKVDSSQSIDIPYGGAPLASQTEYVWQIRTWNAQGDMSRWSEPARFRTGNLTDAYATTRYPLEREEVAPVEVVETAKGHWFIDFGRAMFATVRITLTSSEDGHAVRVHLGEKLAAPQCIDREPPGTIRYRATELRLKKGTHSYTVEIAPDARNTGRRTILMPEEMGEVLPFRYCEVENAPCALSPDNIRQVAVHYPFDEEASAFRSSDPMLNRIWDLCKHTIKATTFCGAYVDGDRERFPREADSYINQICHYAVDREFTMGRHTHEFMITHTSQWMEWMLHSVFMAWADYLHTGNVDSLTHYYDDLVAKLLLPLAREDGLISARTGLVDDTLRKAVHYYEGEHVQGPELRDLVDWPSKEFNGGLYGERDDYDMAEVNTVVNAFHYRALRLMGRMADAVEKSADAQRFGERAERVCETLNRVLFDEARGVYVDGEGSEHASLHANMFPLAFGLVPENRTEGVLSFIRSRGMACSVYGAQYLLEALYESGADTYALELMTARHDRSWWNMIEVGSTMTLEAWDWKYKNNLDWNHAWGAAPTNIIPRYLMGVRPLEPGFGKVLIQPQPGPLERAELRLPTIRGSINVRFENRPEGSFELDVEIPANATARIEIPASDTQNDRLHLNGQPVETRKAGRFLAIDPVGSGKHRVERVRA